MAEYVDKKYLDRKFQIDMMCLRGGTIFDNRKIIDSLPTADVIERSEYEKLQKENEELKNLLTDKSVLEKDGYYKTSCNLIKKVNDMNFRMREIELSKIDKAIEEINNIDLNEYADNLYQLVNKCIDIIKRNIGE